MTLATSQHTEDTASAIIYVLLRLLGIVKNYHSCCQMHIGSQNNSIVWFVIYLNKNYTIDAIKAQELVIPYKCFLVNAAVLCSSELILVFGLGWITGTYAARCCRASAKTTISDSFEGCF